MFPLVESETKNLLKLYYDNKKNGEVDFLIDDYEGLHVLPIEVKSGKDYTLHSALTKFVQNGEYRIPQAYVFSNSQDVYQKGNIWYLSIYYVMFLLHPDEEQTDFVLPDLGNLKLN